jgi:hypothetical protein
MIHNIYAKFREQNEALSKTEMVKRVSEAAAIGLTLVWQTIKEMEETHAVKSPPRKRNRKILFCAIVLYLVVYHVCFQDGKLCLLVANDKLDGK